MTTFVYIDYGPSSDRVGELRYSLATLLHAYPQPPDIVVYTDKPQAYADIAELRLRPLGEDCERWSRGGLYAHRLKPCVLRDALAVFDEASVLVDTDTFFRPGFAQALGKVAGVAMDHFERRDPCPALAEVKTCLPHAGPYVYDPATAMMFNSGLISARRADMAALEDAIAMIDAWLDAGIRQFNIEQIAVSESFRLHGQAVAEMKPYFEHYYRRSQKRYMSPRIAAWLESPGGGRPTRPFLEPSKMRVRWAHILETVANIVQRKV